MSPLYRNHQGFTLIEVIASLVLLGLLAAIFGMGLVASMQSHEFSRANVRLAQKAQPAMTRITRELMELSHIEAVSPPGQETFILYHRVTTSSTAAAQRFGLHFDPGNNTLLLYTNYPGSMPLDVSQADILVDGVDSLTLYYYSEDRFWTFGTDDIGLLSAIEITMVLSRPDAVGGPQQFRTTVHLRNTRNLGGAPPNTLPVSRDDYSCYISNINPRR